MVPRSLPRLRIAVACNVDWSAMVGGDRARFCGQCCQTVYNVERLRPREVADLLERHGERMPCLRLFTRPDGTVVTRTCLHWVTAGVRRVRMGLVSGAALAVAFWSNVFLLRGWLHPTAHTEVVTRRVPAAPDLPPPPPPQPLVEPPRYDPGPLGGIPPRLPEDDRRRLRQFRRGGPVATEQQVKEALQPFLADMRARATELRRPAKVNVLVDVKRSGRVRRVDVIAPADFPPKLRKMVEDASKRLRLPRNTEDYHTEFPLLFQSGQ
jgi:hypothetical protein